MFLKMSQDLRILRTLSVVGFWDQGTTTGWDQPGNWAGGGESVSENSSIFLEIGLIESP